MERIYNLISDWALSDEFLRNLRNRRLEQKFLYLEEGSRLYYDLMDVGSEYGNHNNIYSAESLKSIFDNIPTTAGKDTAFISLWAWNSEKEHTLFSSLSPEELKSITYFAVDSSREMLQLSIDRLSDLPDLNKVFLCSDFSTQDFRIELTQMTKEYKNRIFAFFSNTFGNIAQTSIIDILYNLLNPWEIIRLDVRLRKWLKAKDDLETSEAYQQYLQLYQDFFLVPFTKLGISKESWVFSIITHKEELLNSLKFNVSFSFNEKTRIEYKSDVVTILPHEKIYILWIRHYDPMGLIHFFEEHGFRTIEERLGETRWHFLFQRK